MEFRPFTLVNLSALPAADLNQVIYRNVYLVNKFGKEQAEMKLKAVSEFAQKAGLKMSVSEVIIITLSNVSIIQGGG